MQRKVDDMDKKKRMIILEFLVSSGVKISDHADGTRINIDKLTDGQKKHLFNLVEALSYVNPVNRI